MRVKVDKKATSISTLVAVGVRRDGQKVLLSIKNMGGESEAAWRGFLEDMIARGLKTPELLIIRRRTGVGSRLRVALVGRAGSTLHGSQAQEPSGACPQANA